VTVRANSNNYELWAFVYRKASEGFDQHIEALFRYETPHA
jgi:hypothetical protein